MPPLGHEHAGAAGIRGDNLDVRLDERGEAVDGIAIGCVRRCAVGGPLERGRSAINDRPEDIFFRGNVGVEAGALDVERAGNVADRRRRIAVCVEQLAGNLVDLAPSGTGFDHTLSYLTIVRHTLATRPEVVKVFHPPRTCNPAPVPRGVIRNYRYAMFLTGR